MDEQTEIQPNVPNEEGATLEGQTAPEGVKPGEFVDEVGVVAN